MFGNNLNFEILLENIDIARHIMQFLTYEDQLNVSRVCKKFENIIIDFIWKVKYRQVEVIKRPWINMISQRHCHHLGLSLSNRLDENWHFLKTEEFNEFLRLNKTNIEYLEFLCKFGFTEDHNYLSIDLSNELIKLTTLRFYGVILSNYDLKVVSQNCPLLSALVLEDCVNARKQILVLGHDVNVQTIANMNLRTFKLKSNCIYKTDMHVYNFRHIKDVLTNLIVEYMHLNVAIYSDEDGYNCKDYRRDNIDGIRYMEVEEDITDQNFKNDICQELEIGHFLKNEDFLTFSQNYLSSYPNLNSLTIGGYMFSSTINIDHKLINQISKYCSRLKKIKISGCMIDEFVSFPNLEELTLEACKGLTWIQLKQILSEMNLKSFSSFRTKYSGKHHSISVSQSLEYLDLDLEENDFSLLFNHKLANMKSLIWHTGLNHCQCQDIPTIIPNIQVLKLCHIDAADTNSFFHLKALTTLTFEKCPEIRELLKLLQHSNLKYLALESNPDDLVKFPRSLDRGVIRSMPTTLTHLKIPLNVFKFLQDFCFDLLSSNRNLILTITLSYNRPVDEEFMINMITSKKFPTRIKSLQICGLNIDFADFLNYFPVIMKKIEIVSTMLLSSPQQQTMVLYEK